MPPQPQLAAPQFQLPTERFHSSLRHKGEKYTALYWTQIKNYRVGVLIATNDKDFLQKAKQAMAGVRFYCTADDGHARHQRGQTSYSGGRALRWSYRPNVAR